MKKPALRFLEREGVQFYLDELNELWMTRKQIGDALGYASKNTAIKNIHQRHKNLLESHFQTVKLKTPNNQKHSSIIYNSKGIETILLISNAPEIQSKLYNIMGLAQKVDLYHNLYYKENTTIASIAKALRYFSSEREYVIDSYRVDLFFQDSRLIIECDEMNHISYNKTLEQEREKHLISKGCKIYRYNPDASDFNLENTIADILEILLSDLTINKK